MQFLSVHQKRLPVPSFFQVFNYGGGNGDKDRELVYGQFSGNTPALINYFYINNRYPHSFQSSLFQPAASGIEVGPLYNQIRHALIAKGECMAGYETVPYDFSQKVFLLDSGAFHIVKQVAAEVDYDITQFQTAIRQHMIDYYTFAHRLKVDLVVGFDLGGKYTEKDNEKKNLPLMSFLEALDAEKVNDMLLEETVRFLAKEKDFYPHVLSPVHGKTPEAYAACVDNILALEKKYQYQFWGFALGGIASYKQVDPSWYSDISFHKTGKRGFVETVTPARAAMILRKKGITRPIHALGCGGYANIAMNYFCGATSFDSASPVRRVGDGSLESTRLVYDPTPQKEVGFSKFFVGGINRDGSLRQEPCIYVKLNEISDQLPLCGCPACQEAKSIRRIKDLYAQKEQNHEANYFSRQLMGMHAVWQHRILCETLCRFACLDDFCAAYPSPLNLALQTIYHQL